MYKEITVYTADKPSRNLWLEDVFTCRGVACDEARALYRDRNAYETRILYEGGVPQQNESLYRYVGESDSGLRATAWYLTEEEACEGRVRLKLREGGIQRGILNTETIDPLPQQIQVQFKLDEKGRPFARVNAHPERDGKTAKGKIFFPDRAFFGADSGTARVSVAKEFDTYGFLSGKMVKFGKPDMDRFLDWAWEKRFHIQDVLFINHPGRGEYIAVQQKDGIHRVLDVQNYDGEWETYATLSSEPEVVADAERYLVRRTSLDELFLEAAWGMKVNLDALDAMFVRSRLFESGRVAMDWEESVKFRGALVDSAVQAGVLSQYASPSLHIEVMTFNRQNIALLGNYQYSDVKEIAKAVSKVNQEADATGRAKVEKGLLLSF